MTKRFKQTTKISLLYIGVAFMMMLASCVEKDIYDEDNNNEEELSKDDFFDFSTSNLYTLDVNYGLKDYPVLFELYTSNPMVETNGSYTKSEAIRPVYRAATDKTGKFNGEISLPSYAKTVYLYCYYLGTIRCAELTVDGNKISFDQAAYKAQLATRSGALTRAATSQGYTIPDGYLTLGKWEDKKGHADYVYPGEILPGDFYARLTGSVQKKLNKDASFVASHPSPDIDITAPSPLTVTMISSKNEHEITVGYFTYPTGQVPATPADIKNPIILFPAVAASTGNADAGDQAVMKYWNEETGAFENEFPAGVSVSFFFMIDAFKKNNGSIVVANGTSLEGVNLDKKVDYIFYSNSSLNQKLASKGKTDAQRTLTLSDGNGNAAILFEADLGKVTGSWEYLDVIMGVSFTESAINDDQPKLPNDKEVPTNDQNYAEYYGTLAFEDLWPNQGDYDMNDVGIYYESTVYKDVNTNNIVKIVDVFYAQHNGASYKNGFGYQFSNIAENAIKSVTIEPSVGGLESAFMQGRTMEPGQDHPTFILFDNTQEAVAQMASFTVTTTFNSGVKEEAVRPPYNPFIIAQSNVGRGKEVHLTNQPPTLLANRELLGSDNDRSNANIGLYYASDNGFPFAIHLDRNYFEWPTETVRIDKTYPGFTSWVESSGTNHTDWYLK